ncbi:MAG: hypothetical protein K2R93_19005 [Gemmatimonadaceae bacterium]|nr:hypothetical protein [Gemmatimonadaceae bacterium]
MILFRSRQSTESIAVARPQQDASARPLLWSALAATSLLAGALFATPAKALPVDRTLFTWTGRVDREVYLVVRGRDVQTRGEDAYLPNRTRVNEPLPRTVGAVLVQLNNGRGEVDVIEQPNPRNGYQATIRIRDPRGGADNYRVTAYWQGDDRYDPRDDRRDSDCRPGNNGRGWGWGRNRNTSNCADRDRDRDRDNRNGGWDDRDRRDRDRDRDDRNGGYGNGGYGNGGYGGGGYGDAGMLTWSGRVDDVVEIRISGRRVDTITRSGVSAQNVNFNIRGGGLPQRNVTLEIDQRSGRGAVYVAQQPSSWNGYTAVIRVNDNRGGADFYDFAVRW